MNDLQQCLHEVHTSCYTFRKVHQIDRKLGKQLFEPRLRKYSGYRADNCVGLRNISKSSSLLSGTTEPEHQEKEIAETINKSFLDSYVHERRVTKNDTLDLEENFDLKSETVQQTNSDLAKSVSPNLGNPPEPPITCCMSGCVNCVWIQYAEDLTKYYKDGGERVRKEIEKIEDPNMKMIVKMELGLL